VSGAWGAAWDALARAARRLGRASGDLAAAITRCPEHGPMRYRPEVNAWTCAGWEGEGCPSAWDPEAT
jgi:hypothetical protein